MTRRIIYLVPILLLCRTASHKWAHCILEKIELNLAIHSALKSGNRDTLAFNHSNLCHAFETCCPTAFRHFVWRHRCPNVSQCDLSKPFFSESKSQVASQKLWFHMNCCEDWNRRNLYAFRDNSVTQPLEHYRHIERLILHWVNFFSRGDYILLSNLVSSW